MYVTKLERLHHFYFGRQYLSFIFDHLTFIILVCINQKFARLSTTNKIMIIRHTDFYCFQYFFEVCTFIYYYCEFFNRKIIYQRFLFKFSIKWTHGSHRTTHFIAFTICTVSITSYAFHS